jgi:hypothetical protein
LGISNIEQGIMNLEVRGIKSVIDPLQYSMLNIPLFDIPPGSSLEGGAGF